MDSVIARKTWRTVEPYHSAVYFAPEAAEEYRSVGVTDRMTGYFASRAAPMGAVPAAVVSATFFNFDNDLVERSMEGVWDSVTPTDMVAARFRAADRMIHRIVPDGIDSAEMVEASELARGAALAAGDHPEGRPLFAGHSSLPWPEEPHLILWHAQTLLREFRGDGHIAALTIEGLSGCEALVTHAAAGDISAEVLKATRQHTADDWAEAEDRLRSIGWLDSDLMLTDLGVERRAWIEQRTDELASEPYDAIGVEGCSRLREIVRPLSRAMIATFP